MMIVLTCESMHSLAVMGHLLITLSRVHIVLTLRTSRSARGRTDLILIVHPERLTDFSNSCSKHRLRQVFITVNWRRSSCRNVLHQITQSETSSTAFREYNREEVYSFS